MIGLLGFGHEPCTQPNPSKPPEHVNGLLPRGSSYPNSRVFKSQNPYSEWFLDSETLLFGYLDAFYPKP